MSLLVRSADPTAVKARGWSVSVDGNEIAAGHVVIEHPKFGRFAFGQRPEGSHAIGWGWLEAGGVGIVPYCTFEGLLRIGVVEQERLFISTTEPVLNIPRGFSPERARTFEEGAAAEIREEVGLKGDNWCRRLFSLGDVATNANSTFFDTTDGRGFRYFAFPIEDSEIEEREGQLRFRQDLVNHVQDPQERIWNCRFIPWYKAARVEDNFTSSGVARLLAAKPELIKHLQ